MQSARLRAERELQKLFKKKPSAIPTPPTPTPAASAASRLIQPPPPTTTTTSSSSKAPTKQADLPDDMFFPSHDFIAEEDLAAIWERQQGSENVHRIESLGHQKLTPFQKVMMRKEMEKKGIQRSAVDGADALKKRETMRMRAGRVPSVAAPEEAEEDDDFEFEEIGERDDVKVQEALDSVFLSPSYAVLSIHDQRLLSKFATSLQFAMNSETKHGGEVFKRLSALVRPGERSHYLLKVLTPEAWAVLWALEEENALPSLRAKMIGEMQEAAGIPFTEEQEIAYIGALFWNEGRDRAIERWEAAVESGDASMEMWDLGVRMFALEKDPKRARETIDDCIDDLGYVGARTWIVLIMCWNHLYEPAKAWECYKEMRKWAQTNGDKIGVGKYDDIAMSFLDGGAPSLGLSVFKDMLVAEEVNEADQQRASLYQNIREVVQEGIEQIGDLGDLEELSQMSSEVLKNFPDKARDKYFYAAWMKGLIKMGRTDLAWVIVTDAMKDFGDKPDAQHVNGVIKGFLGEEGKAGLAEAIAEEMILARLRQVCPEELSEEELSPNDSLAQGYSIPPATIQTFSIMIKYYTWAKNTPQINRYLRFLQLSKIQPNAYILNHLLYPVLLSPERFRNILEIFGPNPPMDLETLRILLLHSWRMSLEAMIGMAPLPPHEVYEKYIKPNLADLLPAPPSKLQPLLFILVRAFLASPVSKPQLPDTLRELGGMGIYPTEQFLSEIYTVVSPLRRDRRRRWLSGVKAPEGGVKGVEAGIQGTWVGEVRSIRDAMLGKKLLAEEKRVGGYGTRSALGEKRLVKLLGMLGRELSNEIEILD